MFPTLGYLINYIFGTNIDLGLPTFGFIVALSFIAGAFVLKLEIERRRKSGLIKETLVKETIGAPATTGELIYNAIFGFVMGAKLGLLLSDKSAFLSNPQQAILSLEGNIITGIIGAIAMVAYVYYNKKKKQLDKPKVVERKESATELVMNIVMLAAITGILGAKIFHHFEYWDEFMADPAGQFFAFSGLTFYGGLIAGFLSVGYYVKKKGISFVQICDAAAPALILAYGLGRLGCQLAGDGDWGVINSAYRYDPQSEKYSLAPPESITEDMQQYADYYQQAFGGIENAHYIYFEKPQALSFLPDWMFASVYPYNVNNDGIPIENCQGAFCHHLPIPAIPTPIYEIFMGILIFLILWSIRKRIPRPGLMFSVYLIFNGLERFTIEQFRINSEYPILGGITQAEIISLSLVLLGLLGIYLTHVFRDKLAKF